MAESIMEVNFENNFNLKYICVQLPEPLDENSPAFKVGYKSIADISIGRIKESVKILLKSNHKISDLGVRYYRLVHSNFKTWQDKNGNNIKELESLFDQFIVPLVSDWTKDGLLTEIQLIEGFPLDSKIIPLQNISSNKVYQITNDFYEHSLYICLDEKISNETNIPFQHGGKDVFICIDKSISDQDKLRLADNGLIKTI